MKLVRLPIAVPIRSSNPNPNPTRRGFTLIELIVSAALMSVILGAAYACLTAGLQARELVESRSATAQNARVALALMTADLRNATPLSPEFEFVGMDRTLGNSEADNLDFATHHYSPLNPREGDICEVSYFLEEDANESTRTLWRRRDSSPDDKPLAGGDREIIAQGLEGLRFEYYDGLDWYDTWGDPEDRYKGTDTLQLPYNAYGLPDAVRITLSFHSEPSPGRESKSEPPPPRRFQTVARLELRSSSTSSSEDAEGEGDSSPSPTR